MRCWAQPTDGPRVHMAPQPPWGGDESPESESSHLAPLSHHSCLCHGVPQLRVAGGSQLPPLPSSPAALPLGGPERIWEPVSSPRARAGQRCEGTGRAGTPGWRGHNVTPAADRARWGLVPLSGAPAAPGGGPGRWAPAQAGPPPTHCRPCRVRPGPPRPPRPPLPGPWRLPGAGG